MIEILSTGTANSVQDLGRPGHLAQGIGRGGAMDRTALAIANRLVGNDEGAAGLEIGIMPFRLRVERDCHIAVTGALVDVDLAGRRQPLWHCLSARQGDELRLSPPRAGARACVALSGGLSVRPVLGSSATDLKSGFGGHEGRHLVRGDRIECGPASQRTQRDPDGFGIHPGLIRPDAGGRPNGPAQMVRVLPAAEWEDFDRTARERLANEDWLVTQEANRQGIRLSGALLERRVRRELFSHGIMPGTIQVPPNGQPIIQLADANTCGGYPKIATVIEPDLWRLAQAPPGSRLRFAAISRQEAVDAIIGERQALARIAGLVNTHWTRTTEALSA